MSRPFKFTRAKREKKEKARQSVLAKEIQWRQLTKQERAREYPPERVALLLARANLNSAIVFREDAY